MNLRKSAGILMAAGLVLGLLGSGVGASFVWNGSASQAITVGTVDLRLSSTTPGATVTNTSVICPSIVVDNSAGFTMAGQAVPTCNITVTSVGTVLAKNVSVFMTVTSNGAELGSFQVSQTGLIGTATKSLNSPANTSLGLAIAFPAVINLAFDYGDDIGLAELTNVSMGKTISVAFSLSVSQ